ncbi:hypothetical protein I302_103953 [Kwoniella bestiolae CBS 10118]|uniref:Metallo-beta-lactamase domain-containing protein n=1 Tax=Kwoniella bestiolae CBS 10118 TaxID=1296100 RepID=A0A1B9GA10_9TREE|nr:hypothetical protein I302_02659 [Kwoniella bestiolae CBS 10118]OCF27810.1 hypothetical protein I302_02659 [Kwoniella bestiolae CBS 10118]
MSDTYTQDDPRIKPVPLDRYPWTPLPPSASKDDIVKVSIIPTSTLTAPVKEFSAFAKGDEKEDSPCWSFLIEKGQDAILWDMGLREDPQNAPKKIVEGPLKEFIPHPGPGPIPRLQKHGFDLNKLKLVVFSHQHFDRTLPTPAPPILLGPDSLESMHPGFPKDVNSAWPTSWLEKYHFVELPDKNVTGPWSGEIASLPPISERSSSRRWDKVGCFDRGVDWFGDGSLWFLDAPGHCPGHIMALCRVTSQPDTYVLLGGDASHHQALYLPVPTATEDLRSPIPVIDGKPQLAIDPELATYTIGQLTRMSKEDNVLVILAHEGQVEGAVDQYPGDLSGWKEKGWKGKKEEEVVRQAEARRSS